jgi:hypothetical protein
LFLFDVWTRCLLACCHCSAVKVLPLSRGARATKKPLKVSLQRPGNLAPASLACSCLNLLTTRPRALPFTPSRIVYSTKLLVFVKGLLPRPPARSRAPVPPGLPQRQVCILPNIGFLSRADSDALHHTTSRTAT